MTSNYPAAERSPVVEDFHGTAVADPYRWLEDDTDARTVQWLAAQADLMDAERSGWTTKHAFAERVEQLLGSGTVSPPYWRGDRYFLTRREPGQQFAVLTKLNTQKAKLPQTIFCLSLLMQKQVLVAHSMPTS